MKDYTIDVRITPREGLLDPQGTAILTALHSLGFDGVRSARVGRLIRLRVEADTQSEALDRVEEMCRKLLANPVTEDFALEVFTERDLTAEMEETEVRR